MSRIARRLAALAAGCLLLIVSIPPGADAEVRILEVVGAVPLDQKTRTKGIPKDRAIEEALWEGVSRVADDLLMDSILPESTDDTDPVEEALGRDMVPYTRSFRIVDDQGERPSLFTEHPDAATEYVVVVEVQVEADRVRDRLVAAGLLESGGLTALEGIQVEIRDLTVYAGYAAFVALLTDERVGAASVSPIELEHGRALLRVEAEWGPARLLERVLAAAPPTLRIEPIDLDERAGGSIRLGGGPPDPPRLTLSVEWVPPPDAEAGLPPVGARPGRDSAPGRWGSRRR